LGSVLIEADEPERGERLLREVIARNAGAHNEAMPAARLFLVARLAVTGRVAEAREQLRLLREEFQIAHFVVFDAMILTQEAWVDALDGRHTDALARVRDGLRHAADPLSQVIAPHLPSICLAVAALTLADLDGGGRAGDAARCLAAADALLPPAHVPSSIERAVWDRAEALIRGALDDAAYESAYAEGGGLSLVEATALV
jgi:hypothetical protein